MSGAVRAGREQLHVKLNSERSRCLSSILSNVHYLNTYKHLSGHTYACGACARHDADNILSNIMVFERSGWRVVD